MDDFDRYLNEQMKDPDFKKEWDENEARYQLMMMVLRARNRGFSFIVLMDQNFTRSSLTA